MARVVAGMPCEKLITLFHQHIRERAAEFGAVAEEPLPSLDDLMQSRNGMRYHPVRGMYGGFSFTAVGEPGETTIDVSSWSRVIGGSGRRYLISSDGIRLIEKGFV